MQSVSGTCLLARSPLRLLTPLVAILGTGVPQCGRLLRPLGGHVKLAGSIRTPSAFDIILFSFVSFSSILSSRAVSPSAARPFFRGRGRKSLRASEGRGRRVVVATI